MDDREKMKQRVVEQKEKVEYYSENRSNVIGDFLSKLENPKEPAIAGLVVLAPIAVTLIVLDWLFTKVNQIPGNSYFNLTQYFYVNQSIKIVVLLIFTMVIVTGVGRFVKTRVGFGIEKSVDAFMDRVPILGSVYNISKVTVDTVLSGPEGFKKPAKIDLGGLRATGFKTGNKAKDGRDIVFVPTAPNITSGFVLEIDEDRMIDTDETAEEALTRILSAGFGDSNSKKSDKDKDKSEEKEDE